MLWFYLSACLNTRVKSLTSMHFNILSTRRPVLEWRWRSIFRILSARAIRPSSEQRGQNGGDVFLKIEMGE